MDNLEHILAIELMNAAQGIDFRRPLKRLRCWRVSCMPTGKKCLL